MKLGQGNVFTGMCLSTGGVVCLSACWDIPPPPGPDTPPRSRHPPWEQTPPPPRADTPRPPREADSSIRSTSGRYASYWNAFLLQVSLVLPKVNKKVCGAKRRTRWLRRLYKEVEQKSCRRVRSYTAGQPKGLLTRYECDFLRMTQPEVCRRTIQIEQRTRIFKTNCCLKVLKNF